MIDAQLRFVILKNINSTNMCFLKIDIDVLKVCGKMKDENSSNTKAMVTTATNYKTIQNKQL